MTSHRSSATPAPSARLDVRSPPPPGGPHDQQFGFGFGDSTPAVDPRPAASVGSRPERSAAVSTRINPPVAGGATVPHGPNPGHSRGRALDRTAPYNHSAMDEPRLVPPQTSNATSVRRMAPVGHPSVARGHLDGGALASTSAPTTDRPAPKTPVLLLRLREVTHATGLSKASVYRMEAAGQFPKRIQLSLKSVAWSELDVRAWIESRPRGRPLRNPAQPHDEPPTPARPNSRLR